MKTDRGIISEYNQLHKECDALYHFVAVQLGLSDCSFWILYVLTETKESIRQSELCDNAFMSRQTVNSALKKLEKNGIVELRRIDGKMGKNIHLTETGEKFVSEKIMPVLQAEANACATFKKEEKEFFLRTFKTFVDNLRNELGANI